MSEVNPFTISVCENKPMGAWDLAVQIGGFNTKAGAEHFAKVLGEFLKEGSDTSWVHRVQ
jgi:hypothetical protein